VHPRLVQRAQTPMVLTGVSVRWHDPRKAPVGAWSRRC